MVVVSGRNGGSSSVLPALLKAGTGGDPANVSYITRNRVKKRRFEVVVQFKLIDAKRTQMAPRKTCTEKQIECNINTGLQLSERYYRARANDK